MTMIKKIIDPESLKTRFLIVSLCNLIISFCFAITVLSLLNVHNIYKCVFLSPVFLLLFVLFILCDIFLNLITTGIILQPIRSLTKDLQRFVQDDHSGDINLEHYPELANLLSSTLKLVDSLKKERDVAMMMKKKAESLAKAMERDALTGLYGHEFLKRYLPDEMSRSRILNKSLSLIMLDVDDFKHYNDTNGHPQGDRVLRKLADLIQKSVRNYDISIRYGGEEFCIIMPDTPLDHALKIGERIRQNVEKEKFDFQEKQPSGNLTVSLGLASFPDHAGNETDLIKFADIALYQAKRTGKNKVCVYTGMLIDH